MLDRLFSWGKPKILVADDEECIRSLVADVLSAQGYRVESVEDGQEAVNRLRQEKFDLLIMDVHMPRLEGPQALEVIRHMPNCKGLGIIMLTAESSMDTFIHAFEQGVFAYLPKPFAPAKVIEKVQAYFEKKKS